MNVLDRVQIKDGTGRNGQVVEIVQTTKKWPSPDFSGVETETKTIVKVLTVPDMKVVTVEQDNLDVTASAPQRRASRAKNGEN